MENEDESGSAEEGEAILLVEQEQPENEAPVNQIQDQIEVRIGTPPPVDISDESSEVVEVPAEPTEPIEVQDITQDTSSPVVIKKKRKRSKSRTPSRRTGTTSDDEDDDGMTCPICLDHWEMSGPHRLASLKCGHLFGHSCIKRWIQECSIGMKCCPSCKTKASIRDMRFIYAKRIRALDNTEEYRLRELLNSEMVKYDKLHNEHAIVKAELTSTKAYVLKLKTENKRLEKVIGSGATGFDAGDFNNSMIPLYRYKLFLEKNMEISKDPGCRVMSYGSHIKNLLVSQKSSQSLFPGFGVRFIDVESFRPTNFLHISTKPVRDLSFNKDEELLVSATMEKGVKLFSVLDRNVINVFTPSDKMVWSCALEKETNNFLYLGSQHGSTYVYDVRNPQNYVEEFKNEGDMSPVINICPVPAFDTIPFGGFLVCKLQSVWFYEYVATQEVIPTRLNVDGPFVSMSYEPSNNYVLIATRPSLKYAQCRYVVAKIMKLDNMIALNTIQIFHGSKVQSVMSRCSQICVKYNNSLVAAYVQDTKLLSLWSVAGNSRIQTLPVAEIVLDTCPIYHGDFTYLAALTECKCRIYRLVASQS